MAVMRVGVSGRRHCKNCGAWSVGANRMVDHAVQCRGRAPKLIAGQQQMRLVIDQEAFADDSMIWTMEWKYP